MKKKLMLLVSLLLVLVVAVAGCGNSQESTSTDDTNTSEESESKNNEKKEKSNKDDNVLRVSFGLGDSEWEVFRNEILPAFEQETGIKVEAVYVESSDLVNKLTAEVESGNLSLDMFAQDVNTLSSLVSRDLVQDLSKYKDVIPENVIPGMVEASTFNDQLLFLPYRPNVEIAFFNEKKFSQYGLDVPKTWDDLYNVAKTLKEETGQGRVAIKSNLQVDNILHMFDFIKQAGGDPYVLNDEGSIKAFKFLQKIYPYLNKQSTTANWDTMNQYLEKDSVYLGTNWPFYIPEFHKNGKDEIKAYAGWEGPEQASHVLGGEVIGIPKGSDKVDEAIQFAEFLMSKQVQELLVSELAWPAVRSDGYGLVQGYQKPYFKAIQKALESAEPRGNVPYWADAESVYTEAYQKAVMNGEDVEETLNEAAKKLEKIRSEYEKE